MVYARRAGRREIDDGVVYGTDMPFNWPANVDLILKASFLSNADKEAILGGNLIKLLRLPA